MGWSLKEARRPPLLVSVSAELHSIHYCRQHRSCCNGGGLCIHLFLLLVTSKPLALCGFCVQEEMQTKCVAIERRLDVSIS